MADPTTPTPLQQAFATLAPSQQAALAAILLQQIQQGIDVQILQLALDVAQSPDNPYVLGLFRSIYVVAATDAGTTINLVLFANGDFRSGSQIQALTGGVVVQEGTSVVTNNNVALGAAAVQILPVDNTRKVSTGSCDSAMRIGDSTVTSTTGVLVQPNEVITWKNPAALWATPAVGSSGTFSSITER